MLALGAQAATVQVPTDLLQPALGEGATIGGKTLERALEVDTNTGQRNLDLLLESRSAGDSPAAPPQQPGDLPAKRQTLNLPSSQAPAAIGAPDGRLPLPLGLQTSDTADAAAIATRREWLGGGSPTQPSWQAAGQFGADPWSSRTAGQAAGDGDPGRAPEVVREVLQFLREQRYWLLASLALLAVLVAGLQAYARRP